ncbi:hypothetical protein AB7W15_16545 [Morganella morganii]|uniref:hypothetical protein n=1 Tax=Morganella morganii TaxID=582 RepID=UPI000A9BC6C0|nr:hypothetical protein [Morganella morganii]ELB1545122.1 hypothetical protein [Morganella morganii]SPX90558.1 Uncharacterised protein [Morganella morganii]HDS6843154.1 hypothetical protein [Morganella morganii subsp. morganii]
MKTNYAVSFNSQLAFCMVKVNDILIMDSGDSSTGTMFAGQTVSGLLENGENTITVTMLGEPFSQDGSGLTTDMACEATVEQLFPGNKSEPVITAALMVNDDKQIVPVTPDDKSIVKFGVTDRRFESGSTEVTKKFRAEGLPDWNWTTATPVTEQDIPKIKAFYEELHNAFRRQDLTKIRNMTSGAWEMLATTQGGTPDRMWDSMDFKDYFDNGFKAVPVNWDKFELHTYKDGRIFRYEVGYSRNSPVRLENNNGNSFNYNPYLSVINGKVTVVH